MTVTPAKPAPTLGRFVPFAVILAVAAHVLAVGVFFFQPPSDGGGGGQVLGHLSVSLGGSGAVGPSEKAEVEPVMETPVVPPAPRVEPQPLRVMETPVQKPRVVQAKPTLRQPVEIPRVSEPVEQTVEVNSVTGDAGDGNPVGLMSAGAPTLGEGVVSETVGIGSADAAAGDQRDAYLALIRARIEKNRTYPSAARRRRDEGMAVMRVTIDGQGRLSQAEVITGSGSFHLDRAAKRMVEKSAPFPTPPVAPFTTRIPIVFALK